MISISGLGRRAGALHQPTPRTTTSQIPDRCPPSSRSSRTGLPMGPVIGDIAGHADPHKTAPIPPCLRARSNTLCQYRRAGWLVADDVCPGHWMAQAP